MFESLTEYDISVLSNACNFDIVKKFIDGAVPDTVGITDLDRLQLGVSLIQNACKFKYDGIPVCDDWTDCLPYESDVTALYEDTLRVRGTSASDELLHRICYMLGIGVRYFNTTLPTEDVLSNLPYRFPEIMTYPYDVDANCFLECIMALSETFNETTELATEVLTQRMLSRVQAGRYDRHTFDTFTYKLFFCSIHEFTEQNSCVERVRVHFTDAALEDSWLKGMENLRINGLEAELHRFRESVDVRLSVAGTCCAYIDSYFTVCHGEFFRRKTA